MSLPYKIARGGFGTVYCANSITLEKPVALKSLHKNDELFYEKFVKELANIMAVNNHDNIINYYGVSIDPLTETYYLVLQYAKDGNLRTYLQNNFESLDWEIKINMAKDITSGLRCIHEENIHSKNILVHERRLLITDLGLSQPLDTNSNSMPGGVIAYTDPQYLRDQMKYKRNKPSDIYSLAVIFWELSSGIPPFNNIPYFEIYRKVTSGEREKPINETPKDYIDTYTSAWENDPNKRPTIKNILDSLENIKLENIYDDSNDNQDIQLDILYDDSNDNQLEASMNEFSRDSMSINSLSATVSSPPPQSRKTKYRKCETEYSYHGPTSIINYHLCAHNIDVSNYSENQNQQSQDLEQKNLDILTVEE
ncbi:5965_t:CDS:2, partial [Diversispora eburnea]